jgi:outer membrane murein-binding lipoprotein Lpp
MNSLAKAAFVMVALGVVVSGLTLSGCSHFKNKNSEILSRQDKDSVAAIERQKANGDLTSTEAALEKDSVRRDHILKF